MTCIICLNVIILSFVISMNKSKKVFEKKEEEWQKSKNQSEKEQKINDEI